MEELDIHTVQTSIKGGIIMSFGKFIGLLAVGAIGFVVYSCIVYDPDTDHLIRQALSQPIWQAFPKSIQNPKIQISILSEIGFGMEEGRAAPILDFIGQVLPISTVYITMTYVGHMRTTS